MNASQLLVAPLLLVSGIALAGGVTVDATCTPQVSRLDARLAQKAAEGPDALRQFIFIRRSLYAIDMREAADRAREMAAAHDACVTMSSAPAELEVSPPVALN